MRKRPLLVLSACLAPALFLLIYPIYVIRPFRQQGPRELAAALLITQYRSQLEAICATLATLTLIYAWRQATVFRRSLLVLGVALVFGCMVLCRVNVYEKMFHPLDKPTFSAAAQSKLDPGEEVIAVVVNNVARAYPIRDMSYHHIVNDTVGGRAIAATY